jgi:hypothetical protein
MFVRDASGRELACIYSLSDRDRAWSRPAPAGGWSRSNGRAGTTNLNETFCSARCEFQRFAKSAVADTGGIDQGTVGAERRDHPMLREFKAVAFAMLVLFAGDASGGRAADGGASTTAVDAVSDVYHGVTVADPYRWLENGADPKVHDWSAAQDKRTRAYLSALALRQPIYDRLFKLNTQTSPSYSRLRPAGDRIFAT